MALILLLSMSMFFVMLFATANAIRKESNDDRRGFPHDPLMH